MEEKTCTMCCNKKVFGANNLCENCLEGSIDPLRYTCQRCHQVQTIPHPMWKSQKTVQTETEWSWACHQECNDYTHWVIVEEDIAKIPQGLAPWDQED